MRNPEHQFVPTDTSVIVLAMIAVYERITGAVVRPASPEKLFIQWVASVIIQERVMNNFTGNQNIPSRAEGENLDALGELFYMQVRPAAQAAVCTERFYISAEQSTSILIPAGIRVTDGALIWETTEDTYIPIGNLYADVPIRCQTAGVAGNGYAAGQINRLVDVSDIAYYDRCENITVSDGGAERATDEEYYNLLRSSEDAYSTAGARGGYIYHAKSVSTEITDVVANSPSAGEVRIYALMEGGAIAGREIKEAIYAACNADDVRPLTDHVVIGDAEIVEYDIDFTYYIPNDPLRSSADIESAVQTAVSEYISWQCERLGRDINPDELRQRVKTTGVKRIELNNPAFTVLRDGKDNAVPQVAQIGSICVINGGYEDE